MPNAVSVQYAVLNLRDMSSERRSTERWRTSPWFKPRAYRRTLKLTNAYASAMSPFSDGESRRA